MLFAFIRCFYSKPLLFQTAHPLFQSITCRLKKQSEIRISTHQKVTHPYD